MANLHLSVSSHRFKRSPFFDRNDYPDTNYGIYNNRLYPLSSNLDQKAHYQHLRSQCCLYDVPETPLRITGPDRIAFLNKLFTRDISKIKVGRAGYAIACNHEGGVLMDGVLMRPNDDVFIYVQANGDFLNWANAHAANFDVSIEDFDSWVLQIQGPTSLQVLEAISNIDLTAFPYYAVSEIMINGNPFYVSRTGWTGERGFEIYSIGDGFDGGALWDYLLTKGQPAQLLASNVSSMHIRRIEAGILDYGTDIDQRINPFEIGFGHFVDFKKPDFIGRTALFATDQRRVRLLGLKTIEVTPARGNALVDRYGEQIGTVTAGAWSPTLDSGIALICLNRGVDASEPIMIQQDQNQFSATLCALPFYDPQKKLPR